MGNHQSASRSEIVSGFEAASGDMDGDEEPIFIFTRSDETDVLTGRVLQSERTMILRYHILGVMDDADAIRLFEIAYLDRFTDHYYQSRCDTIRYLNADSEFEEERG